MTSHEHDPLDQDLHDLRALDPAPPPRPDGGREPAAQAMLERILDEQRTVLRTTQSGDTGRAADDALWTNSRRRRPWTRAALAGAAAAAVSVGLAVTSPWSPTESAFATWTPVPEAVSVSALDDIGPECTGVGPPDEVDVVIAEERGRIDFVVVRTAAHFRYCLITDGTRTLSGSANIGRSPDEVPRDDVQTILAGGGGRGETAYTAVIGRVGEEVVGVQVHPYGSVAEPDAVSGAERAMSVTSTVSDGYFGAWWPGDFPEGAMLTIHLADGTVRADVPGFTW